jgi:RNA polymerase sigma factor (sigma-70 family)
MSSAQATIVLRHLRRLGGQHLACRPTDTELLGRFTACRDEAAFAELVQRHGPMVLGVCNGVLRHEQDAEDAFQATFLVLARKAGSIRHGEALAGFLYEVAHHAALQAQAAAARRRAHERAVQETASTRPSLDLTLRDLHRVIHEELRRLPEKYRLPLVLCYLEGHSHEEAANQLGLSRGALRGRLDRGRDHLRRRLVRRGIAPAVTLCAADLCLRPAPAALASVLSRVTAGAFSASASALADRLAHGLGAARIKLAVALLIAVSLGVGLAGFTRQTPASAQPAAASQPKAPAVAKAAPNDAEAATFHGRVLDPAGKPFAGAKIYLYHPHGRIGPMSVQATSGADGRYHFTVRRADFARSGSDDVWDAATPMAVAEGLGLGLPRFDTDGGFADREVTLQLVPDDLPLDGRVIDLQGKPITGVSVRVRGIRMPRDDGLKPFLDALQSQKEGYNVHHLLVGLQNPHFDFDTVFAPVVTDSAGRFRIRGIGRERVADLLIEGPTIESRYVYALTRPAARIEVIDQLKHGWGVVMTHYGSSFDHVAAPCQPIVGVVRDKDTGKPIAGAVVKHYLLANNVGRLIAFRAVTGKDGRYRITGMPKGPGNSLYVSPPADQPFLMMMQEVKEKPGLEPVAVDFALKRGVWIDVRVTDKVTGKPVNSSIEYNAFLDNPHLQNVPGYINHSGRQTWAADGRFRVVGLRGRGLISVWAADNHYRVAVGADKIKGLERDVVQVSSGYFIPRNIHGLAEVNAAEGAESVSVEVALDPGRTLSGTILGPDGKPLSGALVSGLDETDRWYMHWTAPLKTAEFTVTGLDGKRPRLVQVVHLKKGLAGFLILQGDEKGPLCVTLGPAGTLTGRVVRKEGKAAVGGAVECFNSDWFSGYTVFPAPPDLGSFPRSPWTDKDGKFRVEGLIPGLKYKLYYKGDSFVTRIGGPAAENLTVKPGETKELGDLQIEQLE